MKKIVLLVILIAYGSLYAQNTKLRATNVNTTYENVFYRSPAKFNNKEQKFVVTKIVFSSNYKGSKSKNIYQISVSGKVNNKNEQIIYNAKSIEELDYYKRLFKGRYKKILLFEYDYKLGSKNYTDTSISVEY